MLREAGIGGFDRPACISACHMNHRECDTLYTRYRKTERLYVQFVRSFVWCSLRPVVVSSLSSPHFSSPLVLCFSLYTFLTPSPSRSIPLILQALLLVLCMWPTAEWRGLSRVLPARLIGRTKSVRNSPCTPVILCTSALLSNKSTHHHEPKPPPKMAERAAAKTDI